MFCEGNVRKGYIDRDCSYKASYRVTRLQYVQAGDEVRKEIYDRFYCTVHAKPFLADRRHKDRSANLVVDSFDRQFPKVKKIRRATR